LEDNFVKVMKKWATTAVGELQKTTVGYTVTPDSPNGINPLASAFPPISLLFQTAPYLVTWDDFLAAC